MSVGVPYEVTVHTGDIAGAGTDSQIFMKVFGANGCTSDIVLEKQGERFERGRPDLIKVSLRLCLIGFLIGMLVSALVFRYFLVIVSYKRLLFDYCFVLTYLLLLLCYYYTNTNPGLTWQFTVTYATPICTTKQWSG